MIQKAIGLLALLIVSVGVYLYFFLGFTRPVQVTLATVPAREVIALRHFGPYHEIMATLQSVEDWAKSQNLACRETFGHYQDNPELVEAARLRSRAGCVVEQRPANLPANFESDTIAAGRYVLAEFDGSPSIGPMRVYPRVKQFVQDHHLQVREDVFEIYQVSGRAVHTEYLFPLIEGEQK